MSQIQVPKGWEFRKLGDVCTKITDGAHITPTYVNEGIPFLRVKDIGKKIIEKCTRAAEAREAARKARELARRKNILCIIGCILKGDFYWSIIFYTLNINRFVQRLSCFIKILYKFNQSAFKMKGFFLPTVPIILNFYCYSFI